MPPRAVAPLTVSLLAGLLGWVAAASAAPITWTGAVDGSWHTAGNWDLARVPEAGDDVVIPDLPGTPAVTFDAGTTSIQSLSCVEVLVLSGGTLDLAGPSTITGAFTLAGAGTVLTGAGDLAIAGDFTWSGGVMSGGGTTTLGIASSWTVSGPGAVLSRRLHVEGTGVHAGSSITVNSPGMLRIRPGGEFALRSSTGGPDGTGTLQVDLGGSLVRDAGAGTCVVSCPVLNAGTIRCETGGLQFSGGLSVGGALVGTPGTLLLVSGAGLNVLAASTLDIAGELRFTGGGSLIDPAANVSVSGTLSLAGPGSLSLGPDLSVPAFSMTGGTLTGAGHLTVTDTCAFAGGTMSGPGLTTIGAGVAWTLGSAGVSTLSRTLENFGACTAVGTVSLTVISPGQFVNRDGGVLDVQSVTAFAGTGQVRNEAGATIRRASNGGAASISCPLVNDGLMRVESGTLRVASPLTNNGTIESLPGTLLRVSTGLVSAAGSAMSLGGRLAFDLGTSTIAAGATLAANDTVTIATATVNLDADLDTPVLVLRAGGVLQGAGSLAVGSALDWSGGSMGGTGITTVAPGAAWTHGAGATTLARRLVNAGSCSYTGGATTTIAAGGVLRNAAGGVFDLQGDGGFAGSTGEFDNQPGALLVKSGGVGTSSIAGAFTNQGTVRVLAGRLHLAGTFANFSGDTLAGGAYDLWAPLAFEGASIATLQATLVLASPAAAVQDAQQADALAALARVGPAGVLAVRGRDLSLAGLLVNEGVVEIGDGAGASEALEAQGGYRQLGGVTRLDAGTLVGGPLAAPTFVEILGGAVIGEGQLGGQVTNAGTLAPGDSVGAIVISGDFVQSPSGRLEVQLAGAAAPGTDHDRLDVTGSVALGGELAVSLAGGYVPVAGDSFDVVVAGAGPVSGGFASSNLPLAVGTQCLDLAAAANAVRLLAGACGPVAITWTGGAATASWHDAGNWNLNRVPASGDSVRIPDLPGTAEVVYSAGATAIHDLDCDENLAVQGGVLVLDGASAIRGALTFSGGTITGAGDLVLSGAFAWSGSAAMAGTGVTTVDSSGAWTVPALAAPLVSRTLVLRGSGQNLGTLVVPAGRELRVQGGSFQSAAVSSFVVGGVLAALAGDVTVDSLAAFTADSLYAGQGALVTLEGDGSHRALHLDGGRLGGAGDLTITGALVWSSGTLAGTGRLVAPAGLAWRIEAFAGERVLERTIENGGACRMMGGLGTSVLAPGGVFEVGGGGELDLQGDAGFTGDGLLLVSPGGRLVKSAGSGVSVIAPALLSSGTLDALSGTLSLAAAGPFTNGGDVTIGAGATLAADSGYVQAAGSTVLAGGTLAAVAGISLQGGSLSGSGAVAGDLFNAAHLAAGDAPGAIAVTGDFTQAATGELHTSLGGYGAGVGFDALAVSGAAALDGGLVVTLVGGFVPTDQDTFDILVAGAVGGRFATTNLPIDSGPSCLDVEYGAARVRLSTLGITITRQPEAVVACPQASALLTVAAGGPGDPSFQWRRDGVPIPGATDDTLIVSPVTPADAGSYDVVVVTACDSVTSVAVTLSIGTCVVAIHVDASRPAGGDGASWASAFQDLQAALAAAAAAGDFREIWVAAGRYRPDPSSQAVSFQLANKVALYGGFTGAETVREARDPAANRTVLTGDLAGNDGPNFSNNAENSRTVVRAAGVDSTAVLDGFVVTGGNALANGGGIAVSANSQAVFRNCAIDSNFASNSGAGFRSDHSSPSLVDCTFRGNRSSGSGGALSATGSGVVTLSGGAFVANSTLGSGGAISLSTAVTISGTQFADNSALGIGGAINLSAFATSTLALADCDFTHNRTASAAGGIGGAISVGASATLTALRCQFTGNACEQTGAGAPNARGGAIGNLGTSAALTDCAFTENAVRFNGPSSASPCGGGALFGPATLERCTFERNEASGPGADTRGGAVYATSGVVVARNSRFTGNRTTGATANPGGAVAVTGSAAFTAVNCVFSGNTATGDGGAVFLDAARRGLLEECTLVWNSTGLGAGGGVRVGPAVPADSAVVSNSILWSNAAGGASGEAAQVSAAGPAVPRLSHSDVQGLTGALGGAGNIGADPLFTDPDGADEVPGTPDDDFTLRMGSPAVDAGDNAAVSAGVAGDLAGAPRFADDPCRSDTGSGSSPVVDMGAYEFQGNSCALAVDDPSLAGRITFVGAPAPNPTAGAAEIRMRIARETPVRVEVLDVAGRRVQTLLDAIVTAGEHTVRWDGRGGSGQRARPGLYFVRFRLGAEHATRRVLVRP